MIRPAALSPFLLALTWLAGCSATLPSRPAAQESGPAGAITLGIAQFKDALGERDRFLLCEHCPGPTPKTRKTATRIARNDDGDGRTAVAGPDKAVPAIPPEGRTDVTHQDNQIVVEVHFAFDSDRLPPDFADSLRAALRGANGVRAIRIAGYTDDIGPQHYNDRLALRRALALRKALLSLGLPGLTSEVVSAEGRGLCCYVASNDTPEGRRANRRAVAVILPASPTHSPTEGVKP